MIEDPYPRRWKDLQHGIARILNELGLRVEIEKKVVTPRGSVELDVFAVDEASVDNITYVIECKNWSRSVNQSIVHSFKTVMHEVGVRIGFIVSKRGLQSRAREYTRNTNIEGMTYAQFQQRYLRAWLSRYFMPTIGYAGDALSQYIEPINSRRFRMEADLAPDARAHLCALQRHYAALGFIAAMFATSRFMQALTVEFTDVPADFDTIKNQLNQALHGGVVFKAKYLRDLRDGYHPI
jgi:hypothetical protein